MTEENITLTLLDWLKSNGWEIICFDFPQSGTGVSLHPNEDVRTTKNKGAILPDIVAHKGQTVVFFENKDRFVLDDFTKIEGLKSSNDYSNSIQKLLNEVTYTKIFYGVGLPLTDNTEKKTEENKEKIDFAVFVPADKKISVKHQTATIF